MLDSAECFNKINIFKYIKLYVWKSFYKNMVSDWHIIIFSENLINKYVIKEETTPNNKEI